MKKKILLTAALAATLAIGGSTAAYAATSQGWFNGTPVCHTDQVSNSAHLTGKRTADGGAEIRLTLRDGSTCLTTSKGTTISAELRGRG